MARVCVDSKYFRVDDDGLLTFNPGSLGFQSVVQVLGPLVPINFQIADYPGAAWIFVECVGGGGGGAGAQDFSGTTGIAQGGGSGGGYCASWLQASALPPIVPVVGGNGGSGGIGAIPDGDDGTDSSFGTLVIGPGGLGANDNMLASATSGIGKGADRPPLGTGQIRRQGQPGGTAIMVSAFHKTGGHGGASGWPGAGGAGGANNEGGGLGQQYAGGGGGGAAAFNGTQSGGSGGLGIVRITIYN